MNSREILKSAVRDSVGDPDDLVYARRPSLIMLLPEILSARRWDLGLGIGDWDRQILPACYCSGISRAPVGDEMTGQGCAEPDWFRWAWALSEPFSLGLGSVYFLSFRRRRKPWFCKIY